MPAGAADQFVADVKRVSRRSWSTDPDAEMVVAARSTEIIAHIMDAANKRAQGQ